MSSTQQSASIVNIADLILAKLVSIEGRLTAIEGRLPAVAVEPLPQEAPSEPPAPAPAIPRRKAFFDAVRTSLFGGSMTQEQVDGLTRILDYRDHMPAGNPVEWTAYVLATVYHETGRRMQPVEEIGGPSRHYAPYYGRGLVQLTWQGNYQMMGDRLGKPLVRQPELALEWDTALRILWDGMLNGVFTRRKLPDFLGDGLDDPIGARQIVNGTDKAEAIAGYYREFLAALRAIT